MNSSFSVSENNTISVPNYMLVLSDVYGNLLSSFPTDYKDQVSLTLTGDQFVNSNAISFQALNIIGNGLTFTVAQND